MFNALCHGVPGLKARAVCEPYWHEAAVVHVRIETEDEFSALSCQYNYGGDRIEHDAGSCMNADNTPFARGQETFFELEQGSAGPWRYEETEMGVSFRLCVLDGNRMRWTNSLECVFGEEVYVTLTGSDEKDYKIVRTD